MSYDKLTVKQKRFVDEYLIDMNATQAYLRAGYNVSVKIAESSASRLLRNDKVKKALEERGKRITNKIEITQEKIAQQLAKIAFADIKDLVEWEQVPIMDFNEHDEKVVVGYDKVVKLKEMSEVDGTLISEIKETKDGLSFKRADQLKALELLGKYMKMYTDKVETEVSGDIKVNFGIPRPTYKKDDDE